MDLISRWLDGEPGSDDDPIYLEVKAKLDASVLKLEQKIEELEELNK